MKKYIKSSECLIVHAKIVDIVSVAHFVGTLGSVEYISGL